MITRLLAQLPVSDLAGAEAWYTRLFGGGPDERPMDGLLEWHLTDTFGVQVWEDGDRVGRATIVLDESDLDGRAMLLDAAGIEHDVAFEATATRVMPLEDPDGNRIVFTQPL